MSLMKIAVDNPSILVDKSNAGVDYSGLGWVYLKEEVLASPALLTISDIPSGFDILMVQAILRSNDATLDTLTVNINSLSGGSSHEYASLQLYAAVESGLSGTTTDDWRMWLTGASAETNLFSHIQLIFPNYNGEIGSQYRHALWNGTSYYAQTPTAARRNFMGGGIALTSEPVSTIAFDLVTGTAFVADSLYRLYGM